MQNARLHPPHAVGNEEMALWNKRKSCLGTEIFCHDKLLNKILVQTLAGCFILATETPVRIL